MGYDNDMGRSNELMLLEKFGQLVVFMHFLEDIAAADQFAVDVELGVGGPVAVDFYLFADYGVLENIDGFIFGKS